MRNTKRLLALFLALTLVLGLGITAFATSAGTGSEGENAPNPEDPRVETNPSNGKITINDAIVGETYSIYKIFKLESYSNTSDDESKAVVQRYSYKVSEPWKEFMNQTDVKGVYFNVDTDGYVTEVANANLAQFAQKALTYAETPKDITKPKGTEGYEPTIAPDRDPIAADSTTVIFDKLEWGYYLLDTSLGALCSLDTTDTEVVMQEKNEVPQNDKLVKEDSDNIYKKTNHADIGQVVEYQSTVKVHPGTDSLVFHDKVGAGLTFTQPDADAITVYLSNEGGSDSRSLVKGTDFFVEYSDTGNIEHKADRPQDCTFHIRFDDSIFEALKGNGTYKLIISYKATLNEGAAISKVGEIQGSLNESYVSYGDHYHATPVSQTKTLTFGFSVQKIDKETKEALDGADFELHANSATGEAGDLIKLILLEAGNDTTMAKYRVAKATAWDPVTGKATAYETGAIDSIATNKSGRFEIVGLDAGTYHLVETDAPDGYNALIAPVAVNIDFNPETEVLSIKKDNIDVGTGDIVIENGSGSRLPSTGGIGTTIFYVVGSILLVGAAVLLITKKRMSVTK